MPVLPRRVSSRRRLEGGRELAQAPGDPHQRVAVLGQPGASDAAAATDRRGLIAGGRQAGRRVELLGVAKRSTGSVCAANAAARTSRRRAGWSGSARRCRPAAARSGRRRRRCPRATRQSARVAGQPRGAQLGVWRRRQAVPPALGPERRGRVGQPAVGARLQRPGARRAARERRRRRPAPPPGRGLQRHARPCPAGAESPGASALSWSCSRWRSGLSARTSCRRCETAPSSASIADGAAGRPAPWRASQTSAAQSRSSVLNRRVPSCARAAWVSDGANSRSDPGQRRSSSRRPRPMQRAGRLDREHRVRCTNQPLQAARSRRATSATTRLTDQPRSDRSPTPD